LGRHSAPPRAVPGGQRAGDGGAAAGPLLDLLVKRTKALVVGDGSEAGVEMGPLVTADHCRRVAGYIEKGVEEGAVPLVDGREIKKAGGFFLALRFSTTSPPR